MPDSLIIDVDTAALLAAMDRAPAAILARLRAAAKVTAGIVADAAKGRMRRNAAGPTRGGRHTAEGVTVQESHDGTGYVVFVASPEMPNLPQWIEFGTVKMTGDPYLFPAGRAEEGPHRRRALEAIQDGLDDAGLGE